MQLNATIGKHAHIINPHGRGGWDYHIYKVRPTTHLAKGCQQTAIDKDFPVFPRKLVKHAEKVVGVA